VTVSQLDCEKKHDRGLHLFLLVTSVFRIVSRSATTDCYQVPKMKRTTAVLSQLVQPRQVGCPLCATRQFQGRESLPVFATAEALRQHCTQKHWRRLKLHDELGKQPVHADSRCRHAAAHCGLRALAALQDITTSSQFVQADPARIRRRPQQRAFESDTWKPIAASYPITDVAALYAQIAMVCRHCVFLDLANIPTILLSFEGIDPAAETTLRDTSTMIICVCEPCVDVLQFVAPVPYAHEMLAANRFFVHRSHGGSEAGDLVIADLIARISVELAECMHSQQQRRVRDKDSNSNDDNSDNLPVTFHVVGNDRRLAKCLKAVPGLVAPLVEHHAFEKTDAAWRNALSALLELTIEF
jgi:hypothetical protein